MVHASTPRARRHDANHARILDAAMELVVDGGLESLSMARLADAVDFTPGALYRYFGSKDALLARLVAQLLEEVQGFLGRAEASLPRGVSPLGRVFALVQGYRAFARERPHAFGLLAMTLAEPKVLLTDPKDAGPVTERVLAALAPLGAALADAAEAGQLDDGEVPERMVTLFATLQGLLQLQKLARFAPAALTLDRLVPDAVRTLLLGWGARPRAVAAALEKTADLHLRLPGATS